MLLCRSLGWFLDMKLTSFFNFDCISIVLPIYGKWAKSDCRLKLLLILSAIVTQELEVSKPNSAQKFYRYSWMNSPASTATNISCSHNFGYSAVKIWRSKVRLPFSVSDKRNDEFAFGFTATTTLVKHRFPIFKATSKTSQLVNIWNNGRYNVKGVKYNH